MTAHQAPGSERRRGPRPMVHSGFLKAWREKGLDQEVLQHIAVSSRLAAIARLQLALCSPELLLASDRWLCERRASLLQGCCVHSLGCW